MPTYEYRCPSGHVFELFQRFAEDPIEVCEVCGASPVVKVLYPVAVHFKGSGFYSTDYGRGSQKKDAGKEGGAGEGGSGESDSTSEKVGKAEKQSDEKKAKTADT